MFRIDRRRLVQVTIKHCDNRKDASGYGDMAEDVTERTVPANAYPVTSPILAQAYGLENRQPKELFMERVDIVPDDIIEIDGVEHVVKNVPWSRGYTKVICEVK